MFLRKKTALQLMTHYLAHKRDDLWRGAVAGAVGGFAGSGVMQLGQWALTARRHNGRLQPSPQQLREDTPSQPAAEDPAAKAVTAVAQKVSGRQLSPQASRACGTLAHLAFGSGVGALYGAVSELLPATTYAAGAPFGAAVWAAADLGAVPALGFSKPPHRVPMSKHAQMLGIHLAYGLMTDGVRRCMRRVL